VSLSRSTSKRDLSILASGRGTPDSNFFDPNLDSDADTLGMLPVFSKPIDIILINVLEDDSPYPEVRSAVANYDDDEMPVSTIRAWVLGICWAIIFPGVNQFFYMRYPSIVLGGVSFLAINSNYRINPPTSAARSSAGNIPCGTCVGPCGS
jgi:hypothetical protein